LNKTIISCHTLRPGPWNPALEKQTILFTTEVFFRVYSSTKNAAHAKEVNNKNEKLPKKSEKKRKCKAKERKQKEMETVKINSL
jgi:hypothetical protein